MTIPILHGEETIGTLCTRREGAYTLFEARCRPFPGLRRLHVFGEEGKNACLGVLQPEGGELRLRRKLSRAAMRAWPQKLVYASLDPAPRERPVKEAEAGACSSPREGRNISRSPARCAVPRPVCAFGRSAGGAISYFALENARALGYTGPIKTETGR